MDSFKAPTSRQLTMVWEFTRSKQRWNLFELQSETASFCCSRVTRIGFFQYNLVHPVPGGRWKREQGSHIQPHREQGPASYLKLSDSFRTSTLDPRMDVTWKCWS